MTSETSAVTRTRKDPLAPGVHYALFGLGVLFLLIFYRMVWRTRWIGYSDFDQVYMAGWAWRHGIAPYGDVRPVFGVANGPTSAIFRVYYYLPLCGMLAAPISFLPFPLACLVWRLGVFTVLLVGVWRFSQVALPRWPGSLRLFALGITSLAGSVRWNLVQQQPTALIVGLLLLFVWAVLRKQIGWALLFGLLISVKASYLLPVVGLLAFRAAWRALGALAALVVVCNLLALVPTGPGQTITAYRRAMAHFEDPGNQTRPDALDFLTPYLILQPNSPLAPYAPLHREDGHWAGEQIHLPFLFSAWTRSVAQAKGLAALLTLVMLLFLAWVWLRMRHTGLPDDPTFVTLLYAHLLALSLLVVYHQRYDALALIALAYVALAAILRNRRDGAAWVAFLACLLFAYLLTGGMLTEWQARVVVPHGLLVLVPLCGYLTLVAYLASCRMLWRTVQAHGLPPPATIHSLFRRP